jgi:hypothetical protein
VDASAEKPYKRKGRWIKRKEEKTGNGLHLIQWFKWKLTNAVSILISVIRPRHQIKLLFIISAWKATDK